MFNKPKKFELKILFKINSIDSKYEIIFRLISFFGTIFCWFLGVGFFALLGLRTPNILIKLGFGLEPFNIAVIVGIGMGIDFLASNFLQFIFNRKRPFNTLNVKKGELIVRSWEITPSFPSAHVHRAFFGVTLLIWGGIEWASILYILAGVVGISRMYLGAHYPLDVLFGGIFGILISSCYYLIMYEFIQWLSIKIGLIMTSLGVSIIILGSIIGLIIMGIGFYLWMHIRKNFKKEMIAKYGLVNNT